VGPHPSPTASLLSSQKIGDVIQQAGELLVGSSAIAVLWELLVRRSFLDEVLERTNTSTSVAEAGLVDVTFDFHAEIDWRHLLEGAVSIDALFSWAAGWRDINMPRIRETASRRGTRIRIVLPDPDNDETMSALAQRYGKTVDDVVVHIRSALDTFLELKGEHGGRVRVWTVAFPHTFSLYLIDNRAVFALYSHQRTEVSVPAFVCDNEGSLYRYFSDDFNSIVRRGGSGVER